MAVFRLHHRGARAAGLAAGSGVLLWGASPAVGASWLAPAALVPAAYAALTLAGTRAGRAVVPLAYAVQLELLLVPALPFGLAAGQWGDPALPVLIGGSPVLLVALVLAPLFTFVLYLVRFGSPAGTGALGVVIWPAAAWTALDLVRTELDPGAFWGTLFMTAPEPLTAVSALAGPWLLSFGIAAFGYAVALALARRRVAPAVAVALAVAVLVLVADLTRPEPGAPLRVAAVQPGYDTAEDGRPQLRWWGTGTYDLASLDLVEDLGERTRKAARRGARLVIWPEAAVWVDLTRDLRVRTELARLARATKASLVVPYFDPEQRRGHVLAVTPDGELSEPRPKHRAMWYLGEGAGTAPPGTLDGGVADVQVLLGIDNGWPLLGIGSGADLIVSSTHDWRRLAVQQRALARLRAVSAAAPVVRVDWRYGSAIFAADGSLAADAVTRLRGDVLVADVRRATATTLYGRIGDLFAWLCLAGWLAVMVARSLSRARARDERPLSVASAR